MVLTEHLREQQGETVLTKVWTHENHAVELQSIKFMDQKINYIHENPVRAGIVSMPEDYLYSSARNYAGLENELEIDFI